jgi:hypothetical protein
LNSLRSGFTEYGKPIADQKSAAKQPPVAAGPRTATVLARSNLAEIHPLPMTGDAQPS